MKVIKDNGIRHVVLEGEELKPCPFCGEDGFDLVGLKWHLTGTSIATGETGQCEVFNSTLTIEEERDLREKQRQYKKEHNNE